MVLTKYTLGKFALYACPKVSSFGRSRTEVPPLKNDHQSRWASPRGWIAMAILVAAWFFKDAAEGALEHPIMRLLGLHMIQHDAMQLAPYALLMLIRLAWEIALLAVILIALGRPLFDFPLRDRKAASHLVKGGCIGFAVMVTVILTIVGLSAATITPAPQSIEAAFAHGAGWLLFDLVGATGEELYGRASILLVAAWFFGWRGAIAISGLMFSAIHLGNPGVSAIWLLRLFFQGAMLAWAVYRTGSIWWSVGYHTGWNWASAPLFGAAGSGYLAQGHIFDFSPTGSAWITGGPVGPEGSAFAFAAVLMGAVLLWATTRNEHANHARDSFPPW